jgi:hypothetical protein
MKYYTVSRREVISYIQYTKGRLNGLVISWRRKHLLKQVTEVKYRWKERRDGNMRKTT